MLLYKFCVANVEKHIDVFLLVSGRWLSLSFCYDDVLVFLFKWFLFSIKRSLSYPKHLYKQGMQHNASLHWKTSSHKIYLTFLSAFKYLSCWLLCACLGNTEYSTVRLIATILLEHKKESLYSYDFYAGCNGNLWLSYDAIISLVIVTKIVFCIIV